ncbi:MAG TPA: hypothetical protein VIG99_21075 [Myxococcaceae bacterium]
MAAVVVDESAFSTGAADRHCRAHLAGYKVPRRFVVVPELPRNAAGKIDRAALAALIGASQ